MSKFMIKIPEAPAARMADQPRMLRIVYQGGFDGYSWNDNVMIPPDQKSFVFEIPTNTPHFSELPKGMVDYEYFTTEVVFCNASKTRSKTVEVIPVRQ